MANDIQSINGDGKQRLGRIIVKTRGRGTNGTKSDTEHQYTVDLSTESGR